MQWTRVYLIQGLWIKDTHYVFMWLGYYHIDVTPEQARISDMSGCSHSSRNKQDEAPNSGTAYSYQSAARNVCSIIRCALCSVILLTAYDLGTSSSSARHAALRSPVVAGLPESLTAKPTEQNTPWHVHHVWFWRAEPSVQEPEMMNTYISTGISIDISTESMQV